jgi:hypothetical protein
MMRFTVPAPGRSVDYLGGNRHPDTLRFVNPLRSEEEAFAFLIRAVAVIAVIVVIALVVRALV